MMVKWSRDVLFSYLRPLSSRSVMVIPHLIKVIADHVNLLMTTFYHLPTWYPVSNSFHETWQNCPYPVQNYLYFSTAEKLEMWWKIPLKDITFRFNVTDWIRLTINHFFKTHVFCVFWKWWSPNPVWKTDSQICCTKGLIWVKKPDTKCPSLFMIVVIQ